MAVPYKYTDLEKDHIRVLHIHSDLHGDILQASLESVALEDARNTYVALSWHWGKKSGAQKSIQINGQLLSIQPNLEDMLDAFRKQFGSLCVWVDAICINQDPNDRREMNSQIPMMAAIYRTASEVYVWLGPSTNQSDHAMEVWRKKSEDAYKPSGFVAGLLDFISRFWWTRIWAVQEPYKPSEFVLGLIDIISRPWWTRTWIVQEFILHTKCPTIFCGQAPGVSAELILQTWTRMTASDLVKHVNMEWVQRKATGTLSFLRNLRDSRHNPGRVHLEPNLRNALLWLRGFEVSQPRDKIYGTLGLIEDDYRKRLVEKVGVHSENSAARVYLDAMIYLLECEKTSTIFYDFPVGPDNGLEAPSWVPNFHVDVKSAVGSVIRLGDVTSQHLGVAREDVSISADNSTLFLRGRILDMVSEKIVVGNETISGWNSTDESDQSLRTLHLLHKIRSGVHRARALPDFSQLPCEPLWKTLIAGCWGSIPDDDLKDEAACEQRFDEFMAIPLGNLTDLPQTGSWGDTLRVIRSTPPEDLEKFAWCMRIWKLIPQRPRILSKIEITLSTGRVFFGGKAGCYGISEAGSREGDLIALLFPEHFVPFILRPRGTSYEMVGVAYLPGPIREAAIAEVKLDSTLLDNFAIV